MRTLESLFAGPIPDWTNVTELGPPVATEVAEAGDEPFPCPACGQSVTMFALWGHAGCLDAIYWQETATLLEVLG